MSDALNKWEAEARLLEPHHQYTEAEPSRSGKRGVRCILCGHYTNGMERGNCSPCPNHISKRFIKLIDLVREMAETLEIVDDLTQQHGVKYPHIQEVLNKFKEWK